MCLCVKKSAQNNRDSFERNLKGPKKCRAPKYKHTCAHTHAHLHTSHEHMKRDKHIHARRALISRPARSRARRKTTRANNNININLKCRLDIFKWPVQRILRNRITHIHKSRAHKARRVKSHPVPRRHTHPNARIYSTHMFWCGQSASLICCLFTYTHTPRVSRTKRPSSSVYMLRALCAAVQVFLNTLCAYEALFYDHSIYSTRGRCANLYVAVRAERA